jgi:hypothetical protein
LSNEQIQREVCKKYKASFYPSQENLKIGIAKNVKKGILPINGLRHFPEGDTTGWYIWAGEELSNDPNFFVPLHVEHIKNWCPDIIKFLALPPGYRFLTDGKYEDVWFDESLL